MISRRNLFGGLAGLGLPALAGCGGTPPKGSGFDHAAATSRHAVPGLDAVIDISHNVTVTDFAAVRRSNILAIIHKVSEGDWIDPSYATRRRQAEAAGLLWGGYHFGTRQYSGAEQAATFLAACQPGPATVMALDLEPNERKPANTMRLGQAEEFVLAVQRATGRLPLVYTHPAWANGERYGRRRLNLDRPVTPGSLLSRCDLWLADYRETPEIPHAWADRGWRLWQYAADETAANFAHGSEPRAVAGVGHCDRNLFAGDTAGLYRFWNGKAGTT
ncbi:MAG: 1,4-beta-N-acetylmuramidase [Reyranella sp.]|uniref:glycoside hydrolase family 25 protein n=1 Tax=Reyranella sp. TaxID=1929291 RepID=UPI0012281FBA|nr:glycoside hydrolase family 25 protein [Reyranella sp.]TAJ37600.1 MAG: 1,4-beta-N-acetylmuramidase [Reyranella sp.]